jgi:tetratricopeptide (TPR) repeat protein
MCGLLSALGAAICAIAPAMAADEPAELASGTQLLAPGTQVLAPGTQLTVDLAPDSVRWYAVSLPQGMAADLEVTQRSGYVDLDLSSAETGAVHVRTESGLLGRIDAPLLGPQSARAAQSARSAQWLVSVAARKGRGAGSVVLRLSALRAATSSDVSRSSGFRHYVEAEALRFANYRETSLTARTPAITLRTRGAYQAAEADYAAAADGCGLRRARIGRARLEVALENYAEGRSRAQSAMNARCTGDVAERAQALKTLGMAAAYQGDFAASADAAEQSLALYEQTGDLRYQGIVLGNLSAVYMQLGATDRALGAAQGALRAAEKTQDGQGIVFSRKSIADIHLARGELASALQDYRGTQASLATTPYPMVEAETWDDLGVVYHRMADAEESLKAYAMARATWQKMGSRVGEANTLIDAAQTLLELKDTATAIRDLDEALEIARSDGLRGVQAHALRGLGASLLADGNLRGARQFFLQSLRIARATGEITAESYALRDLGDVDYRRGAPAAARREETAALHLAQIAADRDGEAATLALLARTYADGHELNRALAKIHRALGIIETQRGQIDDPSLRTSYFAAMRTYPDTQIDVLMQLDRQQPRAGYAAQALTAAERARARTLQDMLAEKSITVARGLPPPLAEAQRAAEERLRMAAFRLARASAKSGTARTVLRNEFDEASHALDQVRGLVRSANPRYADLMQPVALDVDQVQRTLLDDDVAVLEYWLGARQSTAWIVTRTSFRAIRLPPRAVIEGLAGNLSALLRARPEGSQAEGFHALATFDARESDAIQRAAARLAAALSTDEVMRGLPQHLAIVADGCLQNIPFSILPLSDLGRLGTRHDVSYLPSITTLKWLRRTVTMPVRNASLAIFAAPTPRTVDAALPYSRIEAESIGALLPKDRVWLALGANASRANALAANWRRFSMAHFATHAVTDLSRPELSGIVLAARGDAGVEDGVLRMNDIYNLDMPVDLVVLSGCATATGRDVASEGVLSLSRAFFYAGARRIVASLWPVDDRATAAFMREFYRALLSDHQSAASALRYAQQSLSSDMRWAAPYYWAGFVLQGDWS